MTMQIIHNDVTVSPRCVDCPYSIRVCGARGPVDADFVIVGEAPGATELQDGMPFVGPSGKLIQQVFRDIGHPDFMQKCFITNALQCKPPVNISPSEDAINTCKPRLFDQLAMSKRKVILALGNTALRSLTGNHKLKITQVRGTVFDTPHGLVVGTMHPAAILHNPANDYQKLVTDVKYAVDLYYTPENRKDPGEIQWTVVTPEYVEHAIDRLLLCTMLACDIETYRTDARKGYVTCIGISWNGHITLIFRPDTFPALRRLFTAKHINFIWHNGKYDSGFLNVYYGDSIARVDNDTMLMHYALNEQRGTHGLKQLASEYLGADSYADLLNAWFKGADTENVKDFSKIPERVLFPYLAKDAAYTYQLYEVLKKEIESDPDTRKLYYHLLMPANDMISGIEDRGMLIHVCELNRLKRVRKRRMRDQVAKMRSLIELEMERQGLKITNAQDVDELAVVAPNIKGVFNAERFNPNSHKHVFFVLFHLFKLKPTPPIPGMRVVLSTSKEVVNMLPSHPFVDVLREYRSNAKEYSTYLIGIERKLDTDLRLRSTIKIHGAETGRLSSARPNVMNIPRNGIIKRMFIAPEGYVLIEIDYSQAELRTVANRSGDPFLVDVYTHGRDLHTEVAKRLGISRYVAKTLNFAILYGITAKMAAVRMGISVPEATDAISGWWANAPYVKRYIDWCRAHPIAGKPLVTPFGRKRRFGMVTAKNLVSLQNEAGNFPIQSIASDLLLYSAVRIDESLQALDAWIINLIHDAMLLQVPNDPDVIDRVLRIAVNMMIDVPKIVLGDSVPFDVGIKVGKSWGDMHEISSTNYKLVQVHCQLTT